MTGLKAFRKTTAILSAACALAIVACLLPSDANQRWQLLNGTDYSTLRYVYERIHFDPAPIDVAILGPSKTLSGLSAKRIEEQLLALGAPANVANLSVVAAGRNKDWEIVKELFKAKSPRLLVLSIDYRPHPYGHPAFKYIATPADIAFPPAFFLHNYFYDLAYLPFRQLKLFGAWLFPGLFNLSKKFDREEYARESNVDMTAGFFANGRWIDPLKNVPRGTLLKEVEPQDNSTLAARALVLLNEGDDHVYIRKIADIAREHDARLLFVYLPKFTEPPDTSDSDFLQRYGEILNEGDLSQDDQLYMNAAHLNHAGAMVASDRLARSIVELKR